MRKNLWPSTSSLIVGAGAIAISISLGPLQAAADDSTVPPPAGSVTASQLPIPRNAPSYFPGAYLSLMQAPLPKRIYNQGGIPAVVAQHETDSDSAGTLGSYQPAGPTLTRFNPFFQALGTNGRTCATCHQPPFAMSISLNNIKQRYNNTGGNDPIFAPVDGANCPSAVPDANTSGALVGSRRGKGKKTFMAAHSLLLTRGVIRIPITVPANAEYTLSVVSDPAGCNTDPNYNQVVVNGVTSRLVSVYRRPIISANLPFATAPFIIPGGGFQLPSPAPSMWDKREPNLSSQALDATLGHAQATTAPTAAQIQQIVAFENGIFSAQERQAGVGSLTVDGATGGPVSLSQQTPGQVPPTGITFTEFAAWASSTGTKSKGAARASIFRGQQIFNSRTFSISDTNAVNAFFGNPVQGTCTNCHATAHAGNDAVETADDIGIGGDGSNVGGGAPATDLPIFKLTCPANLAVPDPSRLPAGSRAFTPKGSPNPNDPTKVDILTNDPGVALTTGKCLDIGEFKIPLLRGVSSHPPFFSDGSASSIGAVVDFYNRRFNIGFSQAERQDLINFLNSL